MFFLPYILTWKARVNLQIFGGGEDLQPLICPSPPLEGVYVMPVSVCKLYVGYLALSRSLGHVPRGGILSY